SDLPDERAVWLTAGQRALVRPDLRHDFPFMPLCARRGRHRRGREDVHGGRPGPGDQEEGFVRDRESGHPLHDRMRRVGDRVCNRRFEREVPFAVLLRAAEERREVVRIRSAERIVRLTRPPPRFRYDSSVALSSGVMSPASPLYMTMTSVLAISAGVGKCSEPSTMAPRSVRTLLQ